MFLRNSIFLKKLAFILKNEARLVYAGSVFKKKLLSLKPLNLWFFRIIFFIAFLATLLLATLISAFYLPSEIINLKTDAILYRNLVNDTNTVSYRPEIFILAEDPVFPKYSGFINDYTSTISSDWKNRMNELESFSGSTFLTFLLAMGIPLFISILILLPWLIIGGIVFAIYMRYYLIEHKCPQCNKIGLTIKRKWIEYPTYEQPGKQEVTKWCKYCNYSDKRVVALAKLNRNYGSSSITSLGGSFSNSSSSSHSSSNFFSHHFSSGLSSHSHSSSSHHFGGGSSGGGGASGHW
jgi:hypothetical protein